MAIYNKYGDAIVFDEHCQKILKINSKNLKIEELKTGVIGSDWNGRSFEVDIDWNLLMNVNDKSIKVYKAFGEEEEQELEIRDIKGGYIKDHKPITNKRVGVLTGDGAVSIYSYRFKNEAEGREENCAVFHSCLMLSLKEDEVCSSLAVSSSGTYIVVSSRAVSGFYQRGIYVIKIEEQDDAKTQMETSQLVYISKLDFSNRLGFGNFLAISLPFYVDDSPVLFGLQQYGEGSLCSYILNEGKLVEFFKPIKKFSEYQNSKFEVKRNSVYNMNRRGQLQVITWLKIG